MLAFNIGYERRDPEEMAALLAERGVKVLIDVRDRAWSMRPAYRKTRLKQTLEAHGVAYLHCKAAGNPHRPKRGEPRAIEACAAKYRQHLMENPEVLERVAELLRAEPSALFCYEKMRHQCHRGVLLEELATRFDVEVIDL